MYQLLFISVYNPSILQLLHTRFTITRMVHIIGMESTWSNKVISQYLFHIFFYFHNCPFEVITDVIEIYRSSFERLSDIFLIPGKVRVLIPRRFNLDIVSPTNAKD